MHGADEKINKVLKLVGHDTFVSGVKKFTTLTYHPLDPSSPPTMTRIPSSQSKNPIELFLF